MTAPYWLLYVITNGGISFTSTTAGKVRVFGNAIPQVTRQEYDIY